MVDLARTRLNDYEQRAEIILTDGSIHLPVSDSSCDRVVSNYVLDLLSPLLLMILLRKPNGCLSQRGSFV